MLVASVSRITDIISRGTPHNVESSWSREPAESIEHFSAQAQQIKRRGPRS
jgi:hypothetical protein